MSVWILAIVPFLISAALVPVIIRFAHSHGFVDRPGGRHVHKTPVPRLGGVAVFSALAVGGLLGAVVGVDGVPLDDRAFRLGASVFVAAALLFFVGVWDDLKGLPPGVKLGAQVAAALITCFGGFRIGSLHLSTIAGVDLGFLDVPFTLLWIVAITNAFNLIDGLDGLASGIAIVALVTTATVAGALDHPGVVLMSLLLLGAVLGFVAFNFHPARIFLGDGGSLTIGYLLSVLVMQGGMKNGEAPIAYAAAVLAVPLLDTSLAIARRWLRGTPIFGADARHLHHRLLALGLSVRRASLVLWGLSAIGALLGCALSFAPQFMATGVRLAIVLAVALGVIVMIRALGYHEFSVLGTAFASGPERFRREVQNKIRAWDVAQQLSLTPNLNALNDLLAQHARSLGFTAVEILPADQAKIGQKGLESVLVVELHTQGDRRYVMRMSLRSARYGDLSVAERAIPILARSVEQWLDEQTAAAAPAVTSPRPVTMPATATTGV